MEQRIIESAQLVLNIIKHRIAKKQSINAVYLAKRHKIPYYAKIGAALVDLKMVRRINSRNYEFLLSRVDPIHARQLVNKMKELTKETQNKKTIVTKKVEKPSPVAPTKPSFTIKSFKKMTLVDSVTHLGGYTITGTFTIEKH